jgi:hypothetical protein
MVSQSVFVRRAYALLSPVLSGSLTFDGRVLTVDVHAVFHRHAAALCCSRVRLQSKMVDVKV